MTVQQSIERLSGLGIRTVEYAFRNLAMSSTDPELKAEYLAGKNAWALKVNSIPVEDINQAADSWQMTPIQMHAPDFNIAWPDQKRRRHAVEKTGIALDVCRRLDVSALVVHPGIGDPEVLGSPDAAYDRAREDNMRSVGELAQIAADLGVGITLENRGQDIYGSRPVDLIEMVTSIDPDTLTTCIDTGHANKLGQSPGYSIRELGRHLGATHLHDNEGASDQHLPLFCGNIDWNDVVRSLQEVSYGKPVIIEIRGEEDPRIGDNRVLLTGLAMAHLGLLP
jgi:sugar phosphate isomerase/epimerase